MEENKGKMIIYILGREQSYLDKAKAIIGKFENVCKIEYALVDTLFDDSKVIATCALGRFPTELGIKALTEILEL